MELDHWIGIAAGLLIPLIAGCDHARSSGRDDQSVSQAVEVNLGEARVHSESNPDGLRLEAAVDRLTERLRLMYVVYHSGDSPVFLFTPLSSYEEGRFVPDPERVYADRRGDVLYLSKRLVEIPEDLEVYLPEVPFLTRLDPGGHHREELLLEEPVAVDMPYPGQTLKGSESARIHQIVFSIGYVLAGEVEAKPTVEMSGVYRIGYVEARRAQRLLVTEAIQAEIAIQD